VPIFVRAAAAYRLGPQGWAWLASINRQETNFGRDLSVSSAGATGWMQFLPATWSSYAVDARGTGHPDPYNPTDAIFTAARYLRASGAPGSWARAVLAYNHAGWYLTQVARRARAYLSGSGGAPVAVPLPAGAGNPVSPVAGGCGAAPSAAGAIDAQGYALPLDARYMRQLGRTDDGVDIETAPDGATVYSMTPGRCSAVGHDPPGFGPSYPVIQATAGSLRGQFVYYGHVARALVRPGEAVGAGQPIALIGHTGDAAALGHGHIEIGFSTASGDPLSHHGARSWTPDGAHMRTFLIELDAAFGIRVT
jgi:murein DD-endopeptidase MepM/ murein hydrolase activator NlpD